MKRNKPEITQALAAWKTQEKAYAIIHSCYKFMSTQKASVTMPDDKLSETEPDWGEEKREVEGILLCWLKCLKLFYTVFGLEGTCLCREGSREAHYSISTLRGYSVEGCLKPAERERKASTAYSDYWEENINSNEEKMQKRNTSEGEAAVSGAVAWSHCMLLWKWCWRSMIYREK